ncbi:cysteine-rich receptor-like protein kinase 34 [Silene latifolia]|uniref:cysteine-rich receptor-like protein kinase 34 n=1 Tax=Silene latifolia TaxID=37657 RepID=UPI003D782B9E
MVMVSTLNDLAVQVANDLWGTRYFQTQIVNVSSSISLYVLQQCTPDLSMTDCYSCLKTIIAPIEAWHVELCQGIHVMLPSCNVQYEIHPFFGSFLTTSTNSSASNHDRQFAKKKLIYILVSSFSVIALLLIFGIWICMQRRKALENSNLKIDDIETIEALQFDLSQIRAATHNFSVDNKLGQGGFGVVYKGILDDGQEVALKRLSNNSGQGIQEFKTEVVLLAELRHKNLVKLLGFCLASHEKILVYEYLPNSSLDQFLIDPSKKSLLSWDVRFKIIVGIARGLMYLHEESRLKIIHRDLKSSNVLLDGAMNPKIVDFGLAKLFGVDQTQGDTKRIIGTYGYMAPEYAMTGHFSAKSDVYSFGVIILEILSGQRNRYFGRPQTEEALLHRAWRLWNEGNSLDLIDKELGNDYPLEEARKCIHIGLLCVQENAVDRPRITTIVAALDSLSVSLPVLKAPAFFGDHGTIEKFVHYNQVSVDEIEYHQVALYNGHQPMYTGSQDITTVHPR